MSEQITEEIPAVTAARCRPLRGGALRLRLRLGPGRRDGRLPGDDAERRRGVDRDERRHRLRLHQPHRPGVDHQPHQPDLGHPAGRGHRGRVRRAAGRVPRGAAHGHGGREGAAAGGLQRHGGIHAAAAAREVLRQGACRAGGARRHRLHPDRAHQCRPDDRAGRGHRALPQGRGTGRGDDHGGEALEPRRREVRRGSACRAGRCTRTSRARMAWPK